MKKINTILIILGCLGMLLSAQTAGGNAGAGTGIDATKIGVDTAQQMLKEVSISRFEDAGAWKVAMPSDQGIITLRTLAGAPAGKTAIPDEANLPIKDSDVNALGVKVEFLHRGASFFSIEPTHPLPIEGIVKTVSVWVIGRNYRHTLKLLVEDFNGNRNEISMGSLNFTGWKKLEVSIPTSIIQRDYHFNKEMGLKILGFVVECDILETMGTYYVYFDDLRAVTDLFAESSRDTDDIPDDW